MRVRGFNHFNFRGHVNSILRYANSSALVIGYFVLALTSSHAKSEPSVIPSNCELESTYSIPSTPLAEESIALLALTLSPGACIDKKVYERLRLDIRAIQASDPRLTDVRYRGKYDSRSLLLLMSSEDGEASLLEGTSAEWRRLREKIGGAAVSRLSSKLLLVKFNEPKNIVFMAREFRDLSGVESTELNYLTGSGPTICAHKSEDVYSYIFDNASGDCPSGCTKHDLFYFKSNRPGVITSLGEWDSESKAAPPSWAEQYLKGGRCI